MPAMVAPQPRCSPPFDNMNCATEQCTTHSVDGECDDDPTQRLTDHPDREEVEDCCASSTSDSNTNMLNSEASKVATNQSRQHTPKNTEKFLWRTTWDDWEVGKLLGSGSFASVYQVKPSKSSSSTSSVNKRKKGVVVDLQHTDPSTTAWKENQSTAADYVSLRSSCATTDRSSSLSTSSSTTSSLASSNQVYYALKTLNPEFLDDPDCHDDFSPRVKQAAQQGLQLEARLLSELPRHENIIALVGVSSSTQQQDPSLSSSRPPFLVLERLSESLNQRLQRWRMRQRIQEGRNKKAKCLLRLGNLLKLRQNNHSNSCSDPVLAHEQRLRVAQVGLGVARAVSFLHKNHILYRDLKPDNIGFDANGTVKLFDFGLARRLDDHQDANTSQQQRRLTIQVGSLRYMSPECATSEQYGYATDVYSFAILLWQVVTLETPFAGTRSLADFTRNVFLQHQRPSLQPVRSPEIRQLLAAAWDRDPHRRPSMAPIAARLRAHNVHQTTLVAI